MVTANVGFERPLRGAEKRGKGKVEKGRKGWEKTPPPRNKITGYGMASTEPNRTVLLLL